MVSETNIIVGKKTRRKPASGDIFSFQLEQFTERFYFGRVITTDANLGGVMDGAVILIYIYKDCSLDKNLLPSMSPSKLLLAPIGTNSIPWTQGYFEFIKSQPLNPSDLLPVHCFINSRGWYVNEYGQRLSDPCDPVGFYGLSGMGSIDDKISRALGISTKPG